MTVRTAARLSAAPLVMALLSELQAAEPLGGEAVKGSVRFAPADDAKSEVPDRYRCEACTFEYTLAPRFVLRHTGVEVYDLTFPSPVKSEIPENNTVHAEYYVPIERTPGGRVPAVIVLDILDGAAVVSRGKALWLAQHGVAALFVHMAHYGPRRPPGSKVRLLSTNIERTMAAIRQTVLDCRCATAWLADRPEVDADRLGLVGTSLGSLIGANVAAGEPRIKNVCLLLGGGGLVDAFYDHPKAKPYTAVLDLLGGKEAVKKLIAPMDPLTYAPQLKKKNLLMIAARRDDVVPPKAAEALWEATGKQKIVWFDATHVGAALYALPALAAVTEHVKQ
jgi:cephalosporin-C deacetylase-like acetyl esterase